MEESKMADEVIGTAAAPVEANQTTTAPQPPLEETLEQRVARITAEVNDYLMKNGLQLEVKHQVVLSPFKKAE